MIHHSRLHVIRDLLRPKLCIAITSSSQGTTSVSKISVSSKNSFSMHGMMMAVTADSKSSNAVIYSNVS